MSTRQEQAIRDVETAFWNAMQSRDSSAAGRMTDDECIVVGAQGVSAIDSKAMAKMTAEGKWELKYFEFDAKTMQIRFVTDNIAIIAYTVKETLIVEDKSLGIKANDASVWVRQEGDWRCALHTESLAGDPFGRDKKAGWRAFGA